MILLTQRLGFCSILLLSCFILSCGQQQEINKLIDEINAAGAKARTLNKQAEAKKVEARRKSANGERSESEKLNDETANLYKQISELLNQSANKGEQVVKLSTTDWYKDYFTLYSRWTRNLAKFASSAREELLIRKSGMPTEDQLKVWEENANKIIKENEELRKEIAKIESEHKTVLIKRN
jgi:hypothetical protein